MVLVSYNQPVGLGRRIHMITRQDFEKIVNDVEHVIDYEHLLMILVDHHYRKGNKFRDQGKEALYHSEYEKASSIIDYMEAFHKYNKMMEV